MIISFKPNIVYRKKCQLLTFICFAIIGIMYIHGLRIGLVSSVTDRVKFHAIPVAISVVYHNHPHDYTALREIAMPFQGKDLQHTIAESLDKKINQRETYYWVADDRGFADFIIVAFKLFGPRLKSLYELWFICLTFSVGIFLICYSGRLWCLALLSMTLTGLYATISVLPLADEANFLNIQSSGLLSTVSIYEPRFLDVLTMIPVMHICLFALKRTWPPNRLQVVGLAGQIAFFLFFYHARSSLGWQIVAIFGVSVFVIILNLFRKKQFNACRIKQILSPVLIMVLLSIGLATLTLYKKAFYHPRYHSDMGARTFWHNALMGLGVDPFFKNKYGLDFGDFVAARAVIKYACGGECPDSVSKLEPQDLLNSLGGHGEKNWKAYEDCAQKLYFSIWKNHTFKMVRLYVLTKPKQSLQIVFSTFRDSKQPISNVIRDKLNIGWHPFSGISFVCAFIALSIANVGFYRKRWQILLLLTILLVASLIPSVSFYAVILTMGGFFVTLTVLCHLFMFFCVRSFVHWLYAVQDRER